MRIAVTGADGFVGRWLIPELEAAGHTVVPAPPQRADVRDARAMRTWLAATSPDAVAHLAAVASPRAVAADQAAARDIAVAGTRNLIEAIAAAAGTDHGPGIRPVVLVAGSSEVYGQPVRLPLVETMAIAPRNPYGEVKAAQEGVALELGPRLDVGIVATRSFNHTGPGQTADFAVPAFAVRIVHARRAGEPTFPVGELTVRRDISDVRDIVRAYRLLLEHAAAANRADALVVNVGSGVAVLLRDVVATLIEIAGGGLEPRVDPSLVREGEPAEIVADVARLRQLTGWRPRIDLRRTLADVLAATHVVVP